MKHGITLSLKVFPTINSPQNKDKKYRAVARLIQSSKQKPLAFPFQVLFPKSPAQESSTALKAQYQMPPTLTFRQKLGAAREKP